MKCRHESLLNKPERKTKQAHQFPFEQEGSQPKLARIVLPKEFARCFLRLKTYFCAAFRVWLPPTRTSKDPYHLFGKDFFYCFSIGCAGANLALVLLLKTLILMLLPIGLIINYFVFLKNIGRIAASRGMANRLEIGAREA